MYAPRQGCPLRVRPPSGSRGPQLCNPSPPYGRNALVRRASASLASRFTIPFSRPSLRVSATNEGASIDELDKPVASDGIKPPAAAPSAPEAAPDLQPSNSSTKQPGNGRITAAATERDVSASKGTAESSKVTGIDSSEEEKPGSSMESSQEDRDDTEDEDDNLNEELLEALGEVMVTQGALGCVALLAASLLHIDLSEQIRWVADQQQLNRPGACGAGSWELEAVAF